MAELLHELIHDAAKRAPTLPAVSHRGEVLDYRTLLHRVEAMADAYAAAGLTRGERVGIYLEKRFETVVAMFGAAAAGIVFVPINPILKPRQVAYIMRDCNVRLLVTSRPRLSDLADEIGNCPDLSGVIVVDDGSAHLKTVGPEVVGWQDFHSTRTRGARSRIIDVDMAAILYTSGSTGNPKGVVLSHRNMVAGAKSVSRYLENSPDDRILSVLPLSFDAGLSQLTTAFSACAKVVLLNYLLPRDVVRACADEGITGLTGVPPLWVQLADLEWPERARGAMRYFANTGGHMPFATLQKLRAALPGAKPFLMYGLTEAFRSTYLDPAEVDRRADSIGKAIPNAEILVVRSDGTLCDSDEPGELVHRGALVSLGYWNDPERTAERFRPAPGQAAGLCMPEMAVWSGDIVRRDAEGFLYFVGRRDEMIKTSGYRVSPTEVEEVIYSSGLVGSAAAIGAPHPRLGQGIIAVVTPPDGRSLDRNELLNQCRQNLPQYMVPLLVEERDVLPRNPNGKIDRKLLAGEFADVFLKEGE